MLRQAFGLDNSLGDGQHALGVRDLEAVGIAVAGVFQEHFSPLVISQLTATGGLLILGIGLTLLDIKRINLSNLLPSLLVVVVLTLVFG